jgi:hypothetical protein
LKVILSSDYSEQEATRRFASLDLAGFVPKPFWLQQIDDML